MLREAEASFSGGPGRPRAAAAPAQKVFALTAPATPSPRSYPGGRQSRSLPGRLFTRREDPFWTRTSGPDRLL